MAMVLIVVLVLDLVVDVVLSADLEPLAAHVHLVLVLLPDHFSHLMSSAHVSTSNVHWVNESSTQEVLVRAASSRALDLDLFIPMAGPLIVWLILVLLPIRHPSSLHFLLSTILLSSAVIIA